MPGPHGFAVRFSAVRRRAGCSLTEIHRTPPCNQPLARATLSRPPHPALNVRDDREAPLLARRDAEMLLLIWGIGQ